MAIHFEGRDPLFPGAVITTRERNFHDDSDFYALVWDGEKLTNVEYDTTRYAGGGSATVDATPEVIATANAWAYKTLRRVAWKGYVERLRKPRKGDVVEVVRGRKLPVGTRGKLFWLGEAKTYGGYSAWSKKSSTRVGVALDETKDAAGRYANVGWTYLENLEADASKKLRLSDAKRLLRNLKRDAVGTWLGYMAHPDTFFVR